MCGIAGGISYSGQFFPSKDKIESFARVLQFRGPDYNDCWQKIIGNAYISLSHYRLSIIDLSDTGHQPMSTDAGKSSIVFNGEIYNYRELRKQLENAGQLFKSTSDTEVILKGYETWGLKNLLSRLDGMFAFVLYDKDKDMLILTRDRFGKKPLYYHFDSLKKQLAFSSDIRSFKYLPINRTINHHALGYFFGELSTPRIDTIWNEVKKVPEAHYITYDGVKLGINEYWQLQYSNELRSITRNEIIEKVDCILNKAVTKRLVSDVEVSALLSGGVDSSLVVAMMASNSAQKISTYSVGFEESDFSELKYSKMVAERYNTNHTEIILKPNDLTIIDQLISEFGEPFADSSMLPTYMISKSISQHHKVALSGDGGDEIFAGYYEYYLVHKLSQLGNLRHVYPIAKILSSLLKTYKFQLFEKLIGLSRKPTFSLLNRGYAFDNSELINIFPELDDINSAVDNEHRNVFEQFSKASQNTFKAILSSSLHTRLVNDYLTKVDRSSMYASLEVRSPLLDKDLAEFVAKLPQNQIMFKNEPKSILKEVAEKYLPTDLLYRRKMGFAIPLEQWLKNDLKDNVWEVIMGGKQTMVAMNYDHVEKLIHSFMNGDKVDVRKVWTLYTFHRWCQLS
ncbi:asparagine synthase (glutamine-hydrolyzing) [Fulvivirga sp.]|uniref:asparagine synthase (glutamine-hydrolyzing) n=1 Tax=Fulvivirga sp. TaxID=1931237 RepID=UPI0032EE1918